MKTTIRIPLPLPRSQFFRPGDALVLLASRPSTSATKQKLPRELSLRAFTQRTVRSRSR